MCVWAEWIQSGTSVDRSATSRSSSLTHPARFVWMFSLHTHVFNGGSIWFNFFLIWRLCYCLTCKDQQIVCFMPLQMLFTFSNSLKREGVCVWKGQIILTTNQDSRVQHKYHPSVIKNKNTTKDRNSVCCQICPEWTLWPPGQINKGSLERFSVQVFPHE